VLLNLTSLDIGANRNVDDHTLKGLVPFLPNLTSLSLATAASATASPRSTSSACPDSPEVLSR
jgi:hypothetical protein